MENQNIKVRIFKFDTPIIYKCGENESFIMDHYDFERINFSLLNINTKKIQERKQTYNETSSLWLDYYNQSYSSDFAVGRVHTVSHGVEAVNIDLESLKEKSRLGKDEGILGTSLFLIDKKSGYIYISEDSNSISTKYNINKYFYSAKEKNHYFREAYNQLNDEAHIDGRNRFFTLSLLKPLSLLDQIRNMNSIEELDLYPTRQQGTYKENGLLSKLKNDLSGFMPDLFKAKVSITGINGEITAEKIEELIEYLSQSEKYEQYKLIGKNQYGKTRIFSEDSVTRDLMIVCDTTIEGWPDDEQFFNSVIEKIQDDDQLNIVREIQQNINLVTAEKIIKENVREINEIEGGGYEEEKSS